MADIKYTDIFDQGYNMGVKHVIEYVTNRLYYIPDTWRDGEAHTVLNIVENALKDCKGFLTDTED